MLKINKIDISIKKKITGVWLNYFNEISAYKPLRLFKIVGPFTLGFELNIQRGNLCYEPCLQLIPLTNKYFSPSGTPIFYQTFLDESKRVIWINFDSLVNASEKYFNLINNQTLLPLFGNITYQQLVDCILLVIKNGVVLTRIGIPYYQYEFLIHLAALHPVKETGENLFKLSFDEINKFDEEKLSFFIPNVKAWKENLIFEFKNKEVLLTRIKDNVEQFKLQKIHQQELIYA